MNVLRDAMAVDRMDECGIYFGTTGGQVYCSPDGGDTWNPIRTIFPRCCRLRCRLCHDSGHSCRRPSAFWRASTESSPSTWRLLSPQGSVLDAVEARYPMLRGTIRDQVTGRRRPIACGSTPARRIFHDAPDVPLPEAVVKGTEPFMVVGATAGG